MGIYKKGGDWYVDYYVGGKRKRENAGPSKALAREVLRKRMAERSELRFFPERAATRMTFRQMADKWWQLHGQFARSKSWKLMLIRVNEELGSRIVADIKAGDIQKLYNTVAVRSSKANANRYLTLLKAIFNKARDWGDFHGESPCARIRKAREAPSRLQYLSQDDMARLLRCAHYRIRPVLTCALLTGMRRGEIMSLTWENVDLERGTLYLPRTKSGVPREIPMPAKLREMLRPMGPRKSGPVFEIAMITLRRDFEKAVKAAGLRDFHFHDLRHTFASHFIMRTNDLPALQAILGHSTPAMTMRYAHLSKNHLITGMAAFEGAIPVGQDHPMPGEPFVRVPERAKH